MGFFDIPEGDEVSETREEAKKENIPKKYSVQEAESKIIENIKFLKMIKKLRSDNVLAESSEDEYRELSSLKETEEYELLKNEYKTSNTGEWARFLAEKAGVLIKEIEGIEIDTDRIKKVYENDYQQKEESIKTFDEYLKPIVQKVSARKSNVISEFSETGDYIENVKDMNMDLQKINIYKSAIIDFFRKEIPTDAINGPITKYELYLNNGKRLGNNKKPTQEYLEEQLPNIIEQLNDPKNKKLKEIVLIEGQSRIMEQQLLKSIIQNNPETIQSLIKETIDIDVNSETIVKDIKDMVEKETNDSGMTTMSLDLLSILGIELEKSKPNNELDLDKIKSFFKSKIKSVKNSFQR